MYKVIVNEGVLKDELYGKELIKNIIFQFDDEGSVLFKGRNAIKQFDGLLNPSEPGEATELVVKKYKTPNFIQRITYSYFKHTKAYKAYYNALKLTQLGFDTPTPIAYVEQWSGNMVRSYYYISGSNYNPPVEDGLFFEDRVDEQMAIDFGQFVAQLHCKGVVHHDLNRTNVLYELKDDKYFFSLIDINRMTFYDDPLKLSAEVCFDNLTRFTASMRVMDLVLNSYIESRGWDKETMYPLGLKIKKEHDLRWERKKSFLRKFKKKRK